MKSNKSRKKWGKPKLIVLSVSRKTQNGTNNGNDALTTLGAGAGS